jgi:hypothetical protein
MGAEILAGVMQPVDFTMPVDPTASAVLYTLDSACIETSCCDIGS